MAKQLIQTIVTEVFDENNTRIIYTKDERQLSLQCVDKQTFLMPGGGVDVPVPLICTPLNFLQIIVPAGVTIYLKLNDTGVPQMVINGQYEMITDGIYAIYLSMPDIPINTPIEITYGQIEPSGD